MIRRGQPSLTPWPEEDENAMARDESHHQEAIELEGDEDDSLLDERVHLRPPPQSNRLRRFCTFSAWWWMTNVLMFIVIVYLAFQLDARKNLLSRFELAGDISRIGPRLPHKGITLHAEKEYTRNITSEDFKRNTKDLWLKLLPKGMGLIEVKNPTKHRRLPQPYIQNDKTLYRTAINQELQCLYDIMNSVNDLSLNSGSLGTRKDGKDPAEHLSYCFDYLRQTLMCHGDTALEGLQTSFGSDVDGTDGWNVRHICKPWDRIYNWLNKRKVDDSEWE